MFFYMVWLPYIVLTLEATFFRVNKLEISNINKQKKTKMTINMSWTMQEGHI